MCKQGQHGAFQSPLRSVQAVHIARGGHEGERRSDVTTRSARSESVAAVGSSSLTRTLDTFPDVTQRRLPASPRLSSRLPRLHGEQAAMEYQLDRHVVLFGSLRRHLEGPVCTSRQTFNIHYADHVNVGGRAKTSEPPALRLPKILASPACMHAAHGVWSQYACLGSVERPGLVARLATTGSDGRTGLSSAIDSSLRGEIQSHLQRSSDVPSGQASAVRCAHTGSVGLQKPEAIGQRVSGRQRKFAATSMNSPVYGTIVYPH